MRRFVQENHMLANLGKRSFCTGKGKETLKYLSSYSTLAHDIPKQSASIKLESHNDSNSRRPDGQIRKPSKNRRNNIKSPRYDAQRLIPRGIFDSPGYREYEGRVKASGGDRYTNKETLREGPAEDILKEITTSDYYLGVTEEARLHSPKKIVRKLEALVVSVHSEDLQSRIEYYKEGEAIFASQSEVIHEDSSIFTVMIKLAALAGDAQRALHLFSEIEKHNVSATIYTYRAILEGLSLPGVVQEDDTAIISEIRKIFSLMINDWKMAITKLESGNAVDLDREEEKESALTEKLILSRDAAQLEMITRTETFVWSCSYHLCFLLRVKMIRQAKSLMNLGHELVTSGKSSLLIPHLPCILASRFVITIVMEDQFFPAKLLYSAIKTACATIRDDLFKVECRRLMISNFFPQPTGKNNIAMIRKREQYVVNLILSSLLSAINKFRVPGGSKLAADLLESIYNDEYLASLPPLFEEVSLRQFLAVCRLERPKLCLKAFDAAIEYHQSLENTGESIDVMPHRKAKEPKYGDVLSIWTNALRIAILTMDDIGKGFEILSHVKSFKRGNSRLRPMRMPMNFCMSNFMEALSKKEDWNGALRLLNYHLEDEKESRRGKGQVYTIRFITHFLNLANRTETRRQEDSVSSQDKSQSDKHSLLKRPSLIAMRYILDEIRDEQDLWDWCRDNINTTSGNVNPRAKPGEEDFEPIMAAREFLSAVVLTCQTALEENLADEESAKDLSVEHCQHLLSRGNEYISKIVTTHVPN